MTQGTVPPPPSRAGLVPVDLSNAFANMGMDRVQAERDWFCYVAAQKAIGKTEAEAHDAATQWVFQSFLSTRTNQQVS